jgi:hypothetical protein
MGVSQGLASNGSELYALWKGEPDDDRIFFSQWGGSDNWTATTTIGGNTSVGPSLAVFGGSVYAAWKGEWSDPRLFFSKLEGSNFGPQAQIPGAYSDTGPAICAFGGGLMAAWKNVFDESIWFASYSGSKWSAPAQIPNVGTSVGPSLAVFGSSLYAAWKGEGTDDRIWYASYSNSGWTAQSQIPGVSSSIGVAVTEYDGKLYTMGKGAGSDVSLWEAHFDGTDWSTQGPGIPGNTGPDPVGPPVAFPASDLGFPNYLIADSAGTGKALTGTRLTIIVVEDIVPENGAPYSFQFNCQSPATSASDPFVWQQYMLCIDMDEFIFRLNLWRDQDLASESAYINWDSRQMPNSSGVVPVPNNVLPAGSVVTATLTTGDDDNITGFQFTVSQPNQPTLNSPVVAVTSIDNQRATSQNLAPNLGFCASMIALLGGDPVSFKSGRAIFLFSADNNLSANSTAPAAAFQTGTAETSNAVYAPLPATYPNGEFYQPFGIGSV